ncbi:MAG: GAF domain-containing protein [Chloroflexi bacterium]|nr:GAF domain-containing protein [Chloroflexota bacterium]
MNRVFMETRQVQPVLACLAQKTAEYMNAEGCIVWLQDEDDPSELSCEAAYHMWLGQFQVECHLAPGEGVAGQVLAVGKTTAVSEITGDLLAAPDLNIFGSGSVRSLLAVPLAFNKNPIGVLEFVNKIDGEFEDDAQQLAEALAGSAAIIIANAQLVEKQQCQIKDLEIRNEDLDAFAHSVAHDLQNPLSQVVGFAELLQYKVDALSKTDREYAINALSSSAKKMSAIIQELLLLASVRKAEIAIESLNMGNIVTYAQQRLKLMIDGREAEIIVPETWPTVYGYAPWVEEVWENYLSNGIKYGGTPPKIELGYTERPYGMIQFWVRDNGEGFPPEVEKKLFEPFTELRRRANGGEKSYGLGLSIVSRIVEKLGGTVAAECIQGHGSVFSFTLSGIERTGD